ncbi:MAG: hypothetical protein U0992_24215 [Planctomycetaceae bacterium]
MSAPLTIPPATGVDAEPFSLRKCLRLLRSFGPAAVVASLSLGAGETIMVCGLGSWSAFGLLWLLVLSVVTRGVFVMYLVGRYSAVTGQSFAQRVATLPGPRGWLLFLFVLGELAVLATGLTAIAKPCGHLGVFLLNEHFGLGATLGLDSPATAGLWVNGITSVFLGAALLVSLGSSYVSLEKQQIVICGLMVGGTAIATVLVGPNLLDMFLGAVRFGHLPAQRRTGRAGGKIITVSIWRRFSAMSAATCRATSRIRTGSACMDGELAGNQTAGELAARPPRHDYLPDDREQSGEPQRPHDTAFTGTSRHRATVLLAVTAAFLGRCDGAVSEALVPRRRRRIRPADQTGRHLGADQPVAGAGLLRIRPARAVGDDRQRAGGGRTRGL